MGGVYNQPKHFYRPQDKPSKLDKQLCNYAAIHSAAKAGLADMVQLLLEFDNARFLDVVTYHTQESLAHIVFKIDDRFIGQMLLDLNVDLRYKDASGKHVYDLAKEVSLKRTLLECVRDRNEEEARYEEYYKTIHPKLRAGADARSKAKQARLRQALEHQREGGIEAVEKNMPRLKSAMPGIYREAAATALEASAANGRNRKKKKKKGKKKTAAEEEADKVLEELAALSTEAGEGADQNDSVDRIEQLTPLFDKLKESNKLSPDEREETAAKAFEIVDAIRANVQYFAATDSTQGFSRDRLLRDSNDALRVLQLLSKFHRQLPPAPLQPHVEMYNNPSRKPISPTTAFDKLVYLAGPDVDFAEFITFADHTATLFVDCNRISQAKEVVELIERRLLKMRQRSERFRAYVMLLMEARRHAEIEPILASTEEGRRQFFWYSKDHGMGEGVGVGAIARLDAFYGYRYYFRLPHVQSTDSPAFQRFGALFNEVATDEMPVMCMENVIAGGAETREMLEKIHKLIVDTAQKASVRFYTNRCEVGVKSIQLWGFRFSEREIVRA